MLLYAHFPGRAFSLAVAEMYFGEAYILRSV